MVHYLFVRGTRALPKLLATTIAAASCLPVFAWKPTTHVALAEIALQDVLDDGKVTINRIDPLTGRVLAKVGDYDVDPAMLAAVRARPKNYRAGVLGPDAYPDIATGQSAIHPGDDPRVGGLVGNDPGEGSDAWLQHLWDKSRSANQATQAFVAGYLTHAAGDMFAHTFVNHYAGGKFSIGTNAMRHIVLEGYLGKRSPDVPNWDVSIDGVDGWIYDNLVDVKANSDLSRLLVGSGARVSVPAIYSKIKRDLQRDVATYQAMTGLNRAAYDLSHPGEIAYKQAWIADIDAGLRAWPAFSHDIAKALMFNPEGADVDEAKRLADKYVNQHLLSMSGAPDIVGIARDIATQISEAILPLQTREELKDLRNDLISWAMEGAFGFGLEDIEDELKSPELHFNAVIGPGSPADPTATRITLKDFNQQVLGISDAGFNRDRIERFDYHTFAPAYNTVLMTKLVFLSKDSINRLIGDLQAPVRTVSGLETRSTKREVTSPLFQQRLSEPNVMLGFLNSLDDGRGWFANNGKLVFVRAGVYDKLFMKQIGEDDEPPSPSPSVTRTVSVTIRRAKQIDDLDIDLVGGGADFYPRVSIDGSSKRLKTVLDDDDASPSGWVHSATTSASRIMVKITLYDEDGGLRGHDDLCDINPRSGAKTLSLTVDMGTGGISGDAQGTLGSEMHVQGTGDDDRAEIWFTISRS